MPFATTIPNSPGRVRIAPAVRVRWRARKPRASRRRRTFGATWSSSAACRSADFTGVGPEACLRRDAHRRAGDRLADRLRVVPGLSRCDWRHGPLHHRSFPASRKASRRPAASGDLGPDFPPVVGRALGLMSARYAAFSSSPICAANSSGGTFPRAECGRQML
jgi:hypothetical protein